MDVFAAGGAGEPKLPNPEAGATWAKAPKEGACW